MKNLLKVFMMCAVVSLLCGCMYKTTMIDANNDIARPVAGFDYRDINSCINTAVTDLLQRGRLDMQDGSRAVVNILEIKNDTASLGRDADALSSVLRQELKEQLTNAGKILVYNPDVAQYSTVKITPHFALTGTIAERNLRMDSGVIQKEYYLTLDLIEISSGIEFWQKTVFIGKRVDARNARW